MGVGISISMVSRVFLLVIVFLICEIFTQKTLVVFGLLLHLP